MNINKVIENTYNGDAYLMEILRDNIILNDGISLKINGE